MMSYFPSDIPYMTNEEMEEHGINAKREQGMEQEVNEVIVNELTIQIKNLGLIDECINDVKNALVDISKAYKEQQKNIDEAYQRGFEKGKDVRIKGCEGCMYQDTTIEHNPCNLCCNAFLNRWTAKQTDEEIKVGDEVRILGTDNKFFIVGYEDDCICGFAYGGKTCRVQPVFAQKTGKHIDVDKILEAAYT